MGLNNAILVFNNVISTIKRLWLKRKFGSKERLDFYQILLANLVNSGIDPLKYMMKLKNRYQVRKDVRYYMVKEWTDLLKSGFDMADSLQNWISDEEYLILKTGGNKSGANRLALEKCVFFLQSMEIVDQAQTKIIKSIMFYMGLSLVAFLVFIFFMIPEVESRPSMSVDKNHPFLVEVRFIKENLILFAMLILFLIGLVKKSLNWRPGLIRSKYLDRLPPYNLFKQYKSSGFLVALSAFVSSDMTSNQSLQALSQHRSSWVRYYVEKMVEKQESGDFTTGQVLDTESFFDLEVMDRIEDYVEAGNFEAKIEEIGRELINFMVKRLEALSARIVFLSKMFFLLVVGWLATGMGNVVNQAVSSFGDF
ncbi:MAG: hypothetical protein U9N57_00985 [Pseudomonadota bacterium]|nr:hypothetical protein [Pseudomonadota bacterium]